MNNSLRHPLPSRARGREGRGAGFVVRLERAVGSRPSPPTTHPDIRIFRTCPCPDDQSAAATASLNRNRGGCKPFFLALLDLTELQLDWRGAAEDRDRDLEARAGLVDLLHGAVEGCKRTVGHAVLLTGFGSHRGLRPLDTLLDLMQNAGCLHFRDRHRLVVGAKKARDFRGVLDEMES